MKASAFLLYQAEWPAYKLLTKHTSSDKMFADHKVSISSDWFEGARRKYCQANDIDDEEIIQADAVEDIDVSALLANFRGKTFANVGCKRTRRESEM